MAEEKENHSSFWETRYKHEKYWREVYRVWFVYLLHTPAFIEYLEEAYHKKHPLNTCSPQVQIVSGYDSNWVYPLLPDLWTRIPYTEDFDRLWTRWKRFPGFADFIYNPPGHDENPVISRRRKLVDSDLLPHIAEDMGKLLPKFLDRMLRGEIDSKEVVEWVIWRILTHGDGGPVLKLADPNYFPKRQIEASVRGFLAPFPDLRLPPAGEISPRSGPVRFCAPVGLDSGREIGDLNVLKRNLTFYVLAEENDFGKGETGYERILKGLFGGGILPFDGQINFTASFYEREIEKNLSKNQDWWYTVPRRTPGETLPIRQFGKWVRDRVGEAKKTIEAVAQGWFPRIPNHSDE